MDKRKIILFGGTFDPVHLGHTAVALTALQQIGADKLIFIPAKRSPLKKDFPQAKDEDRMKMLSLAIEDNNSLEVSDYELKGPAPSYTLETVRHFQDIYGRGTRLYWLVGADTISELEHWYGINELIDTCCLSVMYRAGCSLPDFENLAISLGRQRVEKLTSNIVRTPLIDISSTEIRQRLSVGRDFLDLVAPAVAKYIEKHNLYRS